MKKIGIAKAFGTAFRIHLDQALWSLIQKIRSMLAIAEVLINTRGKNWAVFKERWSKI